MNRVGNFKTWVRSQNYHFCDLQMAANDGREAERFNLIAEMQSEVITNCNNTLTLAGSRIEHGVLGGVYIV